MWIELYRSHKREREIERDSFLWALTLFAATGCYSHLILILKGQHHGHDTVVGTSFKIPVWAMKKRAQDVSLSTYPL